MLYDEFITGTGCKDNAHNYKVYKDLEVMYMNSDMTKEEVYEYGKKLVDNSKSPEIIELEARINAEIQEYKEQISSLKADLEYYQNELNFMGTAFTEAEKWWKDTCRARIRSLKEDIKLGRNHIRELRWVLGA